MKDGRKYTCNETGDSSDVRVLDTSQEVSKYNTNICIFVVVNEICFGILLLVQGAVFLDGFAILLKATVNFVMSVLLSVSTLVHPHETTWLPLDRFSLYLIFEYFFKICRENSNLV